MKIIFLSAFPPSLSHLLWHSFTFKATNAFPFAAICTMCVWVWTWNTCVVYPLRFISLFFFRLLTKEVLAVRVVDYGIKMKQFDGDNERDIQRGWTKCCIIEAVRRNTHTKNFSDNIFNQIRHRLICCVQRTFPIHFTYGVCWRVCVYAFHALFFPFSLSYNNNHCHVHYRVVEPKILCVRVSIQVVDQSENQ